jgi:hypothetical protein
MSLFWFYNFSDWYYLMTELSRKFGNIKLPLWFLINLAVWLLLCFELGFMSSLPVISERLAGPDDYMRMVRVFDYLDGNKDFGYLQPRMGPDGGTEVVWSRLVDWPIIVLTSIGMFFTDRFSAAMIAATILPLATLMLFLIAAYWFARQFFHGHKSCDKIAIFSAPAIFLLWAIDVQFFPGRIDHHNWQLINTVMALGFTARTYHLPDKVSNAFAAAAVFWAIGLAIGAEILPWFVIGTVAMGLFWLVKPEEHLVPNIMFGVVVFFVTAFLMLLTRPLEQYLVPACDTISIVFVSYAAAIVLFWTAIAVLDKETTIEINLSLINRLVAASILFVAISLALYVGYDQCFIDPYHITQPELRRIWLDKIDEARPALDYLRSGETADFVMFVGPVIFGMFASAFALFKCDIRNRDFYSVYFIMIIAAILLCLWQMRTAVFAQALAIPAFCIALYYITTAVKNRVNNIRLSRGNRIAVASIFFIAMFAFFVSSMQDRAGNPVQDRNIEGNIPCNIRDVSNLLNDYKEQKTIAAFTEYGSELLFRTGHRVLAGSYHRNPDGILAAHNLLATDSTYKAKQIADKYEVGFILVCQENRAYWYEIAGKGNVPFARRLLDDNAPPWLLLVSDPEIKSFRLYEVIK